MQVTFKDREKEGGSTGVALSFVLEIAERQERGLSGLSIAGTKLLTKRRRLKRLGSGCTPGKREIFHLESFATMSCRLMNN